jgi:putative acetyltransferase
MTSRHSIRQATAEDRAAILSFQRAAIAHVKPGAYPVQALEAWWRTPAFDLDALIAGGRYFVAEQAGRLVAGAGWEPHQRIGDTAVLRAVFVDPAHHSRGLGAAVTQVVEDAAVTAGYDHILAPASLNATGFYRRLGYIGADPDDVVLDDGVRIEYRRMWKHAA